MCYGIVSGEMQRLLLTNSRAIDFADASLFFMKKLQARGDNMRRVANIMQRFVFGDREFLLREKLRKVSLRRLGARVLVRSRKPKPFGPVVRYAKGLERVVWSKDVHKAQLLLEHASGQKLTFRPTWSVGKTCLDCCTNARGGTGIRECVFLMDP